MLSQTSVIMIQPIQVSILLALCFIDIRTEGAPTNQETHTHVQEPEVPSNTIDYDLIEEAKRAWKDLQGSGWGKRSWQDLQSSGWGKRSWQDLQSSGWGKRSWKDLSGSGWGKRGWQDLQTSGWGKRGWQDLQTSGWGKRRWDKLSQSGWGKRFDEKSLLSPEDIEALNNGDYANLSFEDLPDAARKWKLMREPVVDKRDASDWGSMKGAWGKRDPAWHNLKGLWGKRSLDFNRDTYHQDSPDIRYLHNSSENED